ncbi:L-carnitine dehydrogenase [Variibacter gotjawalensis]|uniref:L-carnitine dehydrogenase n=1 Tax=Variibacter gotjawalensis TaxID=1333996 RepID=A0A0S3PY37_9BRAD|nr:thioesterase family protein [Variibacter gotjawalensis]NIK46669.1 acyl-CoA thioester hydrolase [Variibacter gotjawalensis]RZS48572.1 (3S)-malyl-CoA thioesterase [Variibacter gotjawalensis]BAT60834.1 L-carnitine dehydrogenase [Variibacter gotjawalensis]
MLSYKGTVYPWHCDHNGHMNVMWYVGKFDEGSFHVLNALGITPQFLRENNRGMAAVEQKIEYKRELFAGDIVEVNSRVVDIREKVIIFQHVMTNAANGVEAATTTLTVLHTDKTTRRAIAFPEFVREKAAALTT